MDIKNHYLIASCLSNNSSLSVILASSNKCGDAAFNEIKRFGSKSNIFVCYADKIKRHEIIFNNSSRLILVTHSFDELRGINIELLYNLDHCPIDLESYDLSRVIKMI